MQSSKGGTAPNVAGQSLQALFQQQPGVGQGMSGAPFSSMAPMPFGGAMGGMPFGGAPGQMPQRQPLPIATPRMPLPQAPVAPTGPPVRGADVGKWEANQPALNTGNQHYLSMTKLRDRINKS